MAETIVARVSESKASLFQVVRVTASAAPDEQIRHLYTEVNRVLALMSTKINSLEIDIQKLKDKG